VTLRGRRVEVKRPRVRTADGESEVQLSTYDHFADRDPLRRVVLERVLAGVSTRRYRRTQEPVGEQVEIRARSTSKSAVSRTFVERTREALSELMSRQLSDLRLAVMMLDGLELKSRMMIVALGITTEGAKIPLRLWEGSTENATVATALLSDLVERGLDPEQGCCSVLDGSQALRKAVRSVFGEVPVQRCLCTRSATLVERGLDPEQGCCSVLDGSQALRKAVRSVFGDVPVQRCLWGSVAQGAQRDGASPRARPPARQGQAPQGMAGDRLPARARATPRACRRARAHPPRRRRLASGRDGQTLTVIKLGIRGKLRRTLESTNPCESMIDTVRITQRNVKHWSSGEMGLRWTAAGMLEAEKQFRKVIGCTELPRLAVAIERRLHLHQPNAATTQEATIAVTL
jgi:hypothetical protein